MKISEIYMCSQGEGPLTGVPSVLIRTSTCNLRCRWKDKETGKLNLCDTPFTSWNPAINTEMSSQEVYDEVLLAATTREEKDDDGKPKKRKRFINHAIFSGGEPTLWGTELRDSIVGLIQTGFHVTIETNGTRYVEIPTKFKNKDGHEIDLSGQILFSISPKLESSTPFGTKHEKKHRKERINLVVLEALLKRYPSYLKFVITDKEDLKEVKDMEKKLKLPSQRIYLMPEGITPEQILKKAAFINELCIENNWRYSSREQILMYGNKRRT